eukprot:4558990-Alexandrium_andersonii.AAC.1
MWPDSSCSTLAQQKPAARRSLVLGSGVRFLPRPLHPSASPSGLRAGAWSDSISFRGVTVAWAPEERGRSLNQPPAMPSFDHPRAGQRCRGESDGRGRADH